MNKTPEKYLASSRNWKRKNKEHVKKYRKEYYEEKKMKERKAHKKYMTKMRTFILKRLGNKCCQCGFDDVRALQIDHINGGGRKERDKIGSTSSYYRMLRDLSDNEIYEKYQLLCANCNMIKVTTNKEKAYGGN